MKLFLSIRPIIHPSVPSSIHGWHHTGKKTLAEINNPPPPPLHMCQCLGKACLAPVSDLLPWSAVCCYLTGHTQCKHQDFQQPGSPWIHTECGMQRGFGNVVCSCNFIICTVKYTHLCITHGVQTSKLQRQLLGEHSFLFCDQGPERCCYWGHAQCFKKMMMGQSIWLLFKKQRKNCEHTSFLNIRIENT